LRLRPPIKQKIHGMSDPISDFMHNSLGAYMTQNCNLFRRRHATALQTPPGGGSAPLMLAHGHGVEIGRHKLHPN
jgi:hypothetical protein